MSLCAPPELMPAGGVFWLCVLLRRDRSGVDGVVAGGSVSRRQADGAVRSCPASNALAPEGAFSGVAPSPVSWSKHLGRGAEVRTC